MALSPDTQIAILLFLAGQTGSLIFFAGMVAFGMKDHARRLDANEADVKMISRAVSTLEGKEGIR